MEIYFYENDFLRTIMITSLTTKVKQDFLFIWNECRLNDISFSLISSWVYERQVVHSNKFSITFVFNDLLTNMTMISRK